MKKTLIVFLVLVLATTGWVVHLLWSTGQFKTIEPHFSGTCRTVKGVVGAEDITIHPATGVAYISVCDRRTFMAGQRGQPDGEWNYSGGSTNILARIVFEHAGGTLPQSYDFIRRELFDRIGMASAIIEPDSTGVFVGSSYMYATARDWARFGLLINNDGLWKGKRLLPEGWVSYMLTPTHRAPKGQYGAQFWLNAGEKGDSANRPLPSLPLDLAYMEGFNQQIVGLIPSRDLVLVRMGATHDDSWDHEWFIKSVLGCIIPQ